MLAACKVDRFQNCVIFCGAGWAHCFTDLRRDPGHILHLHVLGREVIDSTFRSKCLGICLFWIFSGCDHAGLGPESSKASQSYVSKEEASKDLHSVPFKKDPS